MTGGIESKSDASQPLALASSIQSSMTSWAGVVPSGAPGELPRAVVSLPASMSEEIVADRGRDRPGDGHAGRLVRDRDPEQDACRGARGRRDAVRRRRRLGRSRRGEDQRTERDRAAGPDDRLGVAARDRPAPRRTPPRSRRPRRRWPTWSSV